MKVQGYRQRRLLALLRSAERPLPFGYLVRQSDDGCPSNYTNTHNSLRSLREKGLARQASFGHWEAV